MCPQSIKISDKYFISCVEPKAFLGTFFKIYKVSSVKILNISQLHILIAQLLYEHESTMKYFLITFITLLSFDVRSENINDVGFYAFQDSKAFVEKDSMYRVDKAVVFKYRIDVDSSLHPWKTLTRTVRTQCDSNNFMTIKVLIVFKDQNQAPQEFQGNEEYIQYGPKSYREQMTQYVCESAPY
jgi:hypothetical protein